MGADMFSSRQGSHSSTSASFIPTRREYLYNEFLKMNFTFFCREFALWLTSTLQDKAVSYGCTHRFDREPRAVYHAAPGNEAEVRRAYRAIHTGYLCVFIIVSGAF